MSRPTVGIVSLKFPPKGYATFFSISTTFEINSGIKGEAFFESLIVDYAIPHRIARQNDLGIDFLCEWISGDRPSGLLFLAQVKSTTDNSVKAKGLNSLDYNQSEIYELKGDTGIAKVDERTLNYWKGIGLPVYMFIIIESITNGASNLDCYYKRYTPLLAGHESDDDKDATKMFHKANDGARFLPFSDLKNKIGGFARDLIIDYVRLSYSKGHIIPLIPDQLGFWPFPKKDMPNAMFVFSDIAEWHKDKIKATKRYEPPFTCQPSRPYNTTLSLKTSTTDFVKMENQNY